MKQKQNSCNGIYDSGYVMNFNTEIPSIKHSKEVVFTVRLEFII